MIRFAATIRAQGGGIAQVTGALLVTGAVLAGCGNTGRVKAVSEMTGADRDPRMGDAIAADGVATVLSTAVGGGATTTYAENIGVMAATRVYSTAAYWNPERQAEQVTGT